VAASDSDIVASAMRMIVAVRHEFGRNIDVMHLLHDQAYARSIIELARTSSSDRLREQAAYLERKIFGPREAGAPPWSPPPVAPPGPAPAVDGPSHDDDVQRLRAAITRKYQSGLR
jgi:hypothetical protein